MSKIKNKNHNENNNVIILDFGDYDIKKKKKKKVKKKVNKKKEAIDNLKNTLKLFDEILNSAKQQQINIPEELGQLPDNIEDINTIKEINELNIDLQNRIQAIREMIQKKSQQVQVPSSVGGLPNLFIPSQEVIQPQIQRPIGMPGIIPPRIINESDEDKKTKVDDNNLERVRKALQQEQLVIINKLPEPQRTQAMEEFRKNFNIKPSRPLPPTPTRPLPQIPSSELETRLNFKIGSQNIPEFKAPKGWFVYFDRYKQYIERLEFVALQNTISEGVYHIPLQNYTNLIEAKTALLTDYTNFLNSLSPELQTQMKSEPFFVQIDNDIFTNLRLEPKDLLMKMWREQGKMIKEISQGNEKSDIEDKLDKFGFKDAKLEKQKKDFETKIIDLTNLLVRIKIKIDKGNLDKQNIDQIQTQITSIESKLDDEYNKLDNIVKLSVTTEIDRTRKRLNDMRIELSNTGLPMQEPDVQEPDVIIPKPLTRDELDFKEKNKNLKIIRTWLGNNKNYTSTEQEAVIKIFGYEFNQAVKKETASKNKRNKVRKKLEGFIEAEKQEESALPPPAKPSAKPSAGYAQPIQDLFLPYSEENDPIFQDVRVNPTTSPPVQPSIVSMSSQSPPNPSIVSVAPKNQPQSGELTTLSPNPTMVEFKREDFEDSAF